MATDVDFKRIGNYARMNSAPKWTLTMHKAMSILGYPSFHFSSIYDNVKDSDLWLEAIDAKFNGKGPLPSKPFFDALLGHVGAVSDAPCNLFAEELVACYPDAKVVLVERDIESWYQSWMALCQSAYNPSIFALGRLDPYWLGRITALGGALTRIEAGHAKTIDQARVRSKAAYRQHYRDVRDIVPSDRLLEFKLGDGWEPLCDFLDKKLPDTPFPHENETKANAQSFVELGQRAMKNIAKNAAVLVAVLGMPVAAWLYSRR
ncbi:hypothetical protein LTS10_006689 [Elasticomyces elasticus]|nr:hypothetical protein LTS10_006689 [Elasticomyces elasticus]